MKCESGSERSSGLTGGDREEAGVAGPGGRVPMKCESGSEQSSDLTGGDREEAGVAGPGGSGAD